MCNPRLDCLTEKDDYVGLHWDKERTSLNTVKYCVDVKLPEFGD